ncbi:BrnT family toxin [Ciceribacter sp. RN22]|uniref:BrnT family toxin n=1 Tax=Ciceribacter sp. RN22 TaxID=2954932 RepID=UPI002093E7AB|nr:BrnT family toxin [Ciceribacter sp. RN22]MCO6178368.1 BrnT family toxin [Ciceribacter sp. RN22]
MIFEWDDEKNTSNVAKHGLSFETACRIFEGVVISATDERFDYGEVRTNSIGAIDGIAIVVVTHTDRNGRIRLISARPAKRKERARYAQALQERAQPG